MQNSGGRSPSSKLPATSKSKNTGCVICHCRPALEPKITDCRKFYGVKEWKLTVLSSGVAPCLIVAGVNAYVLWKAHWEHWDHMAPLEERTEYAYQNVRTKNYQWGEGDKVGLHDSLQRIFLMLTCV